MFLQTLTWPKKRKFFLDVHMCPAFFSVQVPSQKVWDSMAIPLAGVRGAQSFLRIHATGTHSCLTCFILWKCVGGFDDPVFVDGGWLDILLDNLMFSEASWRQLVKKFWGGGGLTDSPQWKTQVFPKQVPHNFQAASRCTPAASIKVGVIMLSFAKVFPCYFDFKCLDLKIFTWYILIDSSSPVWLILVLFCFFTSKISKSKADVPSASALNQKICKVAFDLRHCGTVFWALISQTFAIKTKRFAACSHCSLLIFGILVPQNQRGAGMPFGGMWKIRSQHVWFYLHKFKVSQSATMMVANEFGPCTVQQSHHLDFGLICWCRQDGNFLGLHVLLAWLTWRLLCELAWVWQGLKSWWLRFYVKLRHPKESINTLSTYVERHLTKYIDGIMEEE